MCTAFRAYEDTSEVGMAGMKADKRGMKSPVISANHTGMQFFMESDIDDIPVYTHAGLLGSLCFYLM